MSESILHFQAPCPVCGAEVHLVADPERRRSRWCCLGCQSVGEAPFHIEAMPQLQLPPNVPVASA